MYDIITKKMTQTTSEKFLILIQNPEKSNYLISDQMRNIGLIGSILIDLVNEKSIDIENGKIVAKKTKTSLSASHNQILDLISQSKRNRKIKTWISKFSWRSRQYQKQIFEQLEKKRLIRIEHKIFLFFKYYKTRLIDRRTREQIIKEIRDVIFNNKQIDNDNAAILGLIQACKMHKVVCNDKKEIKVCKLKMKEIIKNDSISQGVEKVIKEIQAAVAVVIITSS
ncbi:MAG: GPP34 family phosphoprotein [Bacteroidota bacterium]